MTIKLNKLCILLIILNCLSATLQAQCLHQSSENLAKAEKIWEQAIIAKGGRERILNVKNILTGDSIHSATLFVFPDKVWSWRTNDKLRGGRVVRSQDFGKNIGYIVEKRDSKPFTYKILDDTKERRLANYLPYLLETKWIKPELIGADLTKINGQEFDVVCLEITYPDNQLDKKLITDLHEYIFNRQTHLLFRDIKYFDKSIGGGYITAEYSKYVEVKGIKLATKSIEKFDDGGLWGKFEYTTDIDVDYREDLFDKPPSIADGPDGWKKK